MTKTRNRLISVGIALLLLIAVAVFIIPQETANAAWDGNAADGLTGGGTQADPYLINNASDLACLANSVNDGTASYDGEYIKISDGADIDLGGHDWTPIGTESNPFKGTFDGNKQTITNLTLNGDDCGLFGYNSGTLKDICLEKISVTARENAGGVCVFNNGTIDGCGILSGTINGSNPNGGSFGGISKKNTGTISRCFNHADVTGAYCSGIVFKNSSIVKDCYNAGTIEGASYATGISYENTNTISTCLNLGKIIAEDRTYVDGTIEIRGQSICSWNNFSAVIENCYNDISVCQKELVSGFSNKVTAVADKTTEELCGSALPEGFDPDVWSIGSADSDVTTTDNIFGTKGYKYPYLTNVGTPAERTADFYNFGYNSYNWAEFKYIESANDFIALTKDDSKWSGNYVLKNDIVFEDGTAITPIGNKTTGFTGKFSGNGFTISNFTIDKTNDDNVGLFGFNNGTIMNLAANGTVRGGSSVGGICGKNSNGGTIYNCSFGGKVSGQAGGSCVGGICGENANPIINCFNSADVSGEEMVGGICGFSYLDLSYCVNVGEVTGTSSVGGVCGYRVNAGITDCFYDTDVCSAENAVGNDASILGGKTTADLCSDIPSNFDNKVWQAGSESITPDADKDRYGTRIPTYISLIGVGTPKNAESKPVYNFKTDGGDDWQDYTSISTADEFTDIWNDNSKWSGNYVLGKDITLAEPLTSSTLSAATFTGRFSGNGHVITLADSSYGLISTNRGTIINLAVRGNIDSDKDIGGICEDNYGSIYGCSFEGKVHTTVAKAAGICCENQGTISNCFALADIKADIYAYGICATNFSSDPVKSCYFVGNMDANGNFTGVGEAPSSDCFYNTDFNTSTDEIANGLSTIQMTSYNARTTMNLDPNIWEKLPNDTANGIAYYPSLKGSSYQPSVMFTKKLELEQTSEGTPAIGSKIEFKTKALVTFKNDFGGDDVIAEDTGSSFKVKVGNKTYIIVDNKIEYTADTADDVTFTIINGGSDYFPADYSEDVVIKFEKKGLTAGDFIFTPANDLTFDNAAKAATVTTALKGVGKITVKYYDESGKEAEPINAGTYTVKIDVADGDNYSAATDLTSDKWTFTIAKAAAVTITDYTEVSYSWVTDSDETVTVVGLPANMGEVTVEEQRIDSANVVLATLDNDKCYADGKYTFHLGPNTAENVGQAGIIEVRLSTQNYERVTFLVIVTLNSKENQEAPDETAFDVVFTNDGDNLIATIDTKLKGVEYSFDGTTWSTSNTKTVGHDVSVTAYIRYAETDGKNASPVVSKTANSGHGTLIHHAAVEATCQHDGNIEYWECKVCAKYYSDEAAATEITLADTVLAKTDHKWSVKFESNKDGHWHKCEFCDAVTEIKSHISSGAATTKSAEYCTECGYEISPKKNGGSSGGHYSGGSGNRDTTNTDTNPAINGTQKSWADIASDLTKQTGGTATISLNGETTVPADVIKAIVDNKITVEIISDSTKSWIIDGSEITTVSSLDLSILPGSVDTGALRGVNGVKLDLSVANVPADLKVAFKNQYAGEFANIYKLTDGKLVFQNCVKLASDGTAILPDMTAGEYAVMLCKYSDRPGDINNDGALDLSDALSLLRYTVGLETGENIMMGDFNGDGRVDLADALAVLRWSVGLTD